MVGRDRWTALLVFAFLIGVHFFANAADLVPDKLRCEYRINPVGLDQRAPRLSWLLASTARAQDRPANNLSDSEKTCCSGLVR